MLSAHRVLLPRIRVQTISSELFDYLESISGLEELLLVYFEPEDPVPFEELSKRLFLHVIRRHQHTLQVLCIQPSMESLEWAICYHNMHILNFKCKGLTHPVSTIGLGFEYEDENDSHEEIDVRREDVMVSLVSSRWKWSINWIVQKWLIINLTSNHPKLKCLRLAELTDYDAYDLDIERLLTSIEISPEESATPHFEVEPMMEYPLRAHVRSDYLDWDRKTETEYSYITFSKVLPHPWLV
ncbi:hypothetical protein PM082_003823 [Marasmius tenuissimus]|nr:hypothetical protein PM082_003823 [Marasmius tenuissimus]